MPVQQKDRPLDALREETIDRLVVNYGHGRLSMEAFQRRLDEAFEAADHDTLIELAADLDVPVDAEYLETRERTLGQMFESDAELGVEHMVSVLSGNDRSGEWTVPRELRVTTVLGGTDIDFSNARFTSQTTRIRLFCLLGGVDISVPEGVGTTVNAACLLGGIDNTAPGSADPGAPRLVIDGVVLLGGVDIKLKKTMRERVMAFADAVRAMFGRLQA